MTSPDALTLGAEEARLVRQAEALVAALEVEVAAHGWWAGLWFRWQRRRVRRMLATMETVKRRRVFGIERHVRRLVEEAR